MPALTTDARRQAIALERIAAALESFDAPRRAPAPPPVDKITPETTSLAAKLERWFMDPADRTNGRALNVIVDAIMQATKAETVEWFAALAQRYGFEP